MRTCTDCGCVVGDGGDRAHQTWHFHVDQLTNTLDAVMEFSGMLEDGRHYVPVEDVDTKGRT